MDTTGEVGSLDKGDGEAMNIEFSRSCLRRGKGDALRLRDVVATEGSLAVATYEDGVAVDLSLGFLSGDEELPLNGEERCFPVAL